jgi:hypothetical protein
MGQNEKVIARSTAVGLALLAVIFVLCVYFRWY